VFSAQYPNGGFPQVWPLVGGYHDAITFNDSAMINIIKLLQEINEGGGAYGWLPKEVAMKSKAAEAKALDCLLACQIRVKGRLTVWCQQHDMLTLAPCGARNYEMPALCNSESGVIVLFLMGFDRPSPAMVKAVHEAAAYYERTAIRGKIFKGDGSGDGRHLIDSPDKNSVCWARYSDLKTEQPIFGDRDKTIQDDVNEISKERRNGYSWFGDVGKRLLDHYAKWRKTH
jgi:PelA/Pel-15E family pectate lyase